MPTGDITGQQHLLPRLPFPSLHSQQYVLVMEVVFKRLELGSGSILKLTDVLYIPTLNINIFSAKIIVEGQKVVFENDQCHIYNNDELQLLADISPIANYITNKPIKNKIAATL
jgi:hypothetical protein